MNLPNVPRETAQRLELLGSLLTEENKRQNLVAPSTIELLRIRHIEDSMQLMPLAPPDGPWLDIGSGGGFPGLAVACVRAAPMILAEPRKLRADFLFRAADTLGIAKRVTILSSRVQKINVAPVDVISARAVASLDKLFEMALHLSHPATTWLLMKGASAREELEAARSSWQGEFRLVPSRTDPAAAIVVAHSVRRKG